MAGLFDSLSIAQSGLTAARIGLDVTGQNIANVNTPGYARRVVSQAERHPLEPGEAGRGVEVVEIRALRDVYIEGRIAREHGGEQYDAALLDGLKTVESIVGLPGSSLDARITAFFDAFSELASDVTSMTARDTAVRESQALTTEFAAFAARLAEQRRVADHSIQDAVAELNDLAQSVARLNGRLLSGGGHDAESLRDERAVLLKRMAGLAGVTVVDRGDGAVDVTLGSGHALVVGANAYTMDMAAEPPNGFVSLTIADHDVTGQIGSGRLGGLLRLRDDLLPGYEARLDRLAWDLAAAVNARHAAGFDLDGNPGGPFFTMPATVEGAAAALEVSAAIAADPRLLAAAGSPAPGDNEVARAIAALRDEKVINGGAATATQAWAGLVYHVGSDVRTAESSRETREQIVRQLERLRDQHSAVSLDEEAANLMRYQRSYEANARFFTAIVDTLDILMNMVRR